MPDFRGRMGSTFMTLFMYTTTAAVYLPRCTDVAALNSRTRASLFIVSSLYVGTTTLTKMALNYIDLPTQAHRRQRRLHHSPLRGPSSLFLRPRVADDPQVCEAAAGDARLRAHPRQEVRQVRAPRRPPRPWGPYTPPSAHTLPAAGAGPSGSPRSCSRAASRSSHSPRSTTCSRTTIHSRAPCASRSHSSATRSSETFSSRRATAWTRALTRPSRAVHVAPRSARRCSRAASTWTRSCSPSRASARSPCSSRAP